MNGDPHDLNRFVQAQETTYSPDLSSSEFSTNTIVVSTIQRLSLFLE